MTEGDADNRPRADSRSALLALAESDLKARYGRGRWRMAKWLLDPFFALGVYLILVAAVLDRPGRAPGLSIACAVVPFQLVITTVQSSLFAVRNRRSIILNTSFDRRLIPLSTVIAETLAFASALLLLVLMMVVSGVTPTAHALWLAVFIPLTIVLAAALAYPATLVGVHFREFNVFAVSLVRTLFFVAPGLVPLDTVPDTAATWLKLNPLSGLFEGYRSALLYGRAPEAWQILIPLAVAALAFAVFVPLYLRDQAHLAKVVE